MSPTQEPGAQLAAFAAGLRFEDIPATTVAKIEDLLIDWVGSALAGRSARPVSTFTAFVRANGPCDGPSEILADRSGSSPYFAATANAAASHFVEQDDVHNGSVFHPATVVFPVALAAAQAIGASGPQMLCAAVAGYEAGIRVGEFLGRTHYQVFHTTGTAGTIAAAAAAGNLLGLDAQRMQHAFGSAGTQSAGLWEFLRSAADSKQLHTSHAAAAGWMSAWLAASGFTGARDIFCGPQGMAAGMSSDADPAKLADGLGTRWATVETSFKYHAACRHTHPAADALLAGMREHRLRAEDIGQVVARVHQGAIDVLGPVTRPSTVHQAKFSIGTVLALAAQHGHAGLQEFDADWLSPATEALRERVRMELDSEVNAAYPQRWIGKVTVTTRDGRSFDARVDEPKGDPGNTLSREELCTKARRLALYGEGASVAEIESILDKISGLRHSRRVGRLLDQAGTP